MGMMTRTFSFLKIFLLIIIVSIIIFRLFLPTFLIRYAENKINSLPGYRVKIADLDVQLLRGSYIIKNIQLWKIKNQLPVPFFKADAIDLSLQWRPLLHGKFVGKIITNHPVLNFVDDPKGKNQQLTINEQWIQIVKSLFPLNINRAEVENGEIHLRSFTGNPPFNIYLKNVAFILDNMQAVTKEDSKLLSHFTFDADIMNGGKVMAQGRLDPFAHSPTFKMNAELKTMDVVSLKDFLSHYTSIGLQKGMFSLYFEAAAADGKISGYAKPFVQDLKVGPRTKNPIEALYNGSINLLAKILENADKKTVATKIKLQGNIEDPNVSILSVVGYLIRHAFIQALLPQIDNTVKMQDVIYRNEKTVTAFKGTSLQ